VIEKVVGHVEFFRELKIHFIARASLSDQRTGKIYCQTPDVHCDELHDARFVIYIPAITKNIARGTKVIVSMMPSITRREEF
jgi:hypothetical protein